MISGLWRHTEGFFFEAGRRGRREPGDLNLIFLDHLPAALRHCLQLLKTIRSMFCFSRPHLTAPGSTGVE